MKIILDDMRIRYAFLKQKVDGLVHYDTPTPFIEAIEAHLKQPGATIDVLFLDHDLGDGIPQERVETYHSVYGRGTIDGTHVCAALIALSQGYPSLLDTQIVIHSVNDYGARNMESLLQKGEFKDVSRVQIDRLYELIFPDKNLAPVCDVCFKPSGPADSKKARIITHFFCDKKCILCDSVIPGGLEDIQICNQCSKNKY